MKKALPTECHGCNTPDIRIPPNGINPQCECGALWLWSFGRFRPVSLDLAVTADYVREQQQTKGAE